MFHEPDVVIVTEDPLHELVQLYAPVAIAVRDLQNSIDLLVCPNFSVEVHQNTGQLRSIDDSVTILIEPTELVDHLVPQPETVVLLCVAPLIVRRPLFLLGEHPLHRILDQGAADDVVDTRAVGGVPAQHVRVQPTQILGIILWQLRNRASADFPHETPDVRRFPRNMQSAELVQDASHGPDVRRKGIRFLLYHLGAYVIGRPHEGVR
mmetsp:Transcript_122522/g.346479  ORF Transcript_122522/g.346479 Transcript_122522/m.346479 type:complete len:208 (+) Transcript_122522:712-1335(+)